MNGVQMGKGSRVRGLNSPQFREAPSVDRKAKKAYNNVI
jgi:hypothetical protein